MIAKDNLNNIVVPKLSRVSDSNLPIAKLKWGDDYYSLKSKESCKRKILRELLSIGYRFCRKCNKVMKLCNFDFCATRGIRYRSVCKVCRRKEYVEELHRNGKKIRNNLPIIDGKKTCKTCQINRPIEMFNKGITKSGRITYRTVCKICLLPIEREKYRETKRIGNKRRRDNDPIFKMLNNLRTRIRTVIKFTRNPKRTRSYTKELIGITPELFIKDIINKLNLYYNTNYTEDILKTKHNYTLDHIIPCEAFDLSTDQMMKVCFNYKNMQLLTTEDNIKKSDYLPNGTRARHLKEKIKDREGYIKIVGRPPPIDF